MKKYLKYFAPAAALLALVAFILLLVTPGVVSVSNNSQYNFPGTTVLFGGTVKFLIFEGQVKLAWSALVAWILIIIAVVAFVVLFVLEMLKVSVLDKYAPFIKLGLSALLIIAAIFVFVTVPVFEAVNELRDLSIGVGYVFAGILAILAAGVGAVPSVLGLIKK